MTTEQKFNCIFCKDVFDNKEELQVHFRKHADPKFKSKRRFGNDPQVSNEMENEKSEMVSCDVCSLKFPTISKAITHKHKVHPDHDVKYFCPWCGKLFTMKHPYNIHIQTSHDHQEQEENKIFHCDCCDVDFFLPSAMVYHNRFFHRQDTDIPDVGISKKLRLYNQEILQIHYCAFCGEEYENKVNLYKHIMDDHADENQSPEEILRCPLCDAIFYHLDAYEIHLTFHTTEDLYSDHNELFSDLLDFSLETVPPVIEKVENGDELEGEAHSQDTDPENNVEAVGIEKFLELAMGQAADEADDSNPGKVKKKKHKKSKKAAITLNEFLSMNQDVFGEDLDFQGVEEVPTRIVAKQLKNNKKSTNTATAAELEKLKQKGIVVVKVGASKPTKNAQKKVVKKATSKRELKTSSEVLTKLMNQSNNQIKIMKKPKDLEQQTNTSVEDSNISNHDATVSEIESKDEYQEDIGNKDIDESENTVTKSDNLPLDNNINSPLITTKECLPIPPLANTLTGITISKNTTTLQIDNDKNVNIDKESNSISNITANLGQNLKINRIDNPTKLVENKNDVETSNNSNDKQLNEYRSDHEESDSEVINKGNITDPEDFNDEHSNESHTPSDNPVVPNTKPVVNSLSTLKHLSHLTVKPVNQNKNTAQDTVQENVSQTKLDEKSEVRNELESSRSVVSTENDIIPPTKSKIVVDKDPTLDTLKTLSKNLTIKSLSTPMKRSIDENGSDDDDNINKEVPKSASNIRLKDVTGNKNITIKKIKAETNEPANKVINTVNNTVKTVQSPKILNKVNTSATEIKSSKSNENVQNSPIKYKTDILKNLPNITTKPIISTKKIGQAQVVKQNDISIKTVEAKHREEEIIEISDIDDSDNEADDKVKQPETKESTKSIDPFKNLSKHITVKSLNPPNVKIKVEKPEEETYDDDYNHEFNSDDDIPPTVKVCGQRLSNKSMAFKNVLKNLSKNITVKSRNSSPCQTNRSQDHNLQDFHEDKNDSGNDSDTDAGKIKITELEDNVHSDDNFEENFNEEHCDNNPIVESPHDSCSENDEVDEKNIDFESEINASTVIKNNQEMTTNKNTMCLNNLKNISKSLTIKSLNTNSANRQEKTKLTPPQEHLETVKNQTKPLAIKESKQHIKESSSDNTNMNKNFKQMGKMVDHTSNESMNQKVSVNKEVTVKTFQSKTVIQEITTTVTKTIKTVNQTVKQETRNSSQMSIPVLPQRVIGMRPSTAKNLQGVVIRHATPTTPVRPNNMVAQIRPAATVVRPSKQIVPMRPGLNMTRPRMPSAKPNLPKSSPNKQVIGKPLKFSPSAITSGIAKRPNTEEASGPFSCFKKPKESLIPVSDVPVFAGGSDVSVQVKSASHTSTSNYMSTSKMVKGNSIVTATQMKSEVTSMQHMSRLGNAVGIKVKSAQMKQSHVQERSETSAQVKQSQVQEKCETSSMKRTTLEAIEKLQKQGLLVKKPRVEVNENSDDDDHADGNVDYSSVDEHDQ